MLPPQATAHDFPMDFTRGDSECDSRSGLRSDETEHRPAIVLDWH